MRFSVSLAVVFLVSHSVFGLGVYENTRTSVTGHVFTQVTSRPNLGDAWKDEDGNIWSDISSHKMSRTDAKEYCISIGAVLPSNDQFARLDDLIGNSSATMDANNNFLYARELVEVIPNLAFFSVWSSTLDSADVGYVFSYGIRQYPQLHDIGNFYLPPHNLEGTFARCVTR